MTIASRAPAGTVGRSGPFTLAVSAEMIFVDLPFAERVRRLHQHDLQVELWDWTRHDIEELVALREEGVVYSSMTGYVTGNFGDGADELVATAERSVAVARRLGIPRLNLHGTGLDGDGLPVVPADVTPALRASALATLGRLAMLGEANEVMFVLENLNTAVDHPGVPFGRAAECLDLVRTVDHPSLRLMLDLYHAQIGEGNLVELCREALPWVGEIQVADVPGRCEPGTGEIRYRFIAEALARMGYAGPVGLEAFASTDPELALARFREVFTV